MHIRDKKTWNLLANFPVCVVTIVKTIEKLKERCSLNFSIVRNAICLSSTEIIYNTDTSVLRANKLIQKLYNTSIIFSVEADKTKQEY